MIYLFLFRVIWHWVSWWNFGSICLRLDTLRSLFSSVTKFKNLCVCIFRLRLILLNLLCCLRNAFYLFFHLRDRFVQDRCRSLLLINIEELLRWIIWLLMVADLYRILLRLFRYILQPKRLFFLIEERIESDRWVTPEEHWLYLENWHFRGFWAWLHW